MLWLNLKIINISEDIWLWPLTLKAIMSFWGNKIDYNLETVGHINSDAILHDNVYLISFYGRINDWPWPLTLKANIKDSVQAMYTPNEQSLIIVGTDKTNKSERGHSHV